MAKEFEGLSDLLDVLLINSKAHICIHDISGILRTPNMQIDPNYKVHSKPFCDAAKRTARGYRLCLSCKMHANRKAVKEKQIFSGHCPYGLFEIACPVEADGEVLAIVYVGNLVMSAEEAEKRISAACRVTGASGEMLKSLLSRAQRISDPDPYKKMAKFIASYMKRLYSGSKKGVRSSSVHWAVDAADAYIQNNLEKNITLKDVARLHFINEKYLGQLFHKQMGMSFTAYLNHIRLERAKELLVNTKDRVIAVSAACGYQNVTYFNRVFKRSTGKTPMRYRTEMTV